MVERGGATGLCRLDPMRLSHDPKVRVGGERAGAGQDVEAALPFISDGARYSRSSRDVRISR